MGDFTVLNEKKKKIDKALQDIIAGCTEQDSLINSIVLYMMFPGGKRVRSLLTLLIYEMLGGTKGNIYTCACAPEMIHTATLMLDDLPCMDDSSYRRSKLSCHKKFGDAYTILTAFGLASESFRILSDQNNFYGITSEQSLTMMHEISYRIGFNGLIAGQIADLNSGVSLNNKANNEQRLNYTTSNKTAVLFEVCALIACCLAQATPQDTKNMITYTHNFGLALQIFDDLQDNNEDKGLSFPKVYGIDKSKELLHQAVKTAQASIIYENDAALLLKQLPQLLLEKIT